MTTEKIEGIPVFHGERDTETGVPTDGPQGGFHLTEKNPTFSYLRIFKRILRAVLMFPGIRLLPAFLGLERVIHEARSAEALWQRIII